MRVPSSIKRIGQAPYDPLASRRAALRGLEQARRRTPTPVSRPLPPASSPKGHGLMRSWHWMRQHAPLVITALYGGLIIVFWREFLRGIAIAEGYVPPRSAPIWAMAASSTSFITSTLLWMVGIGFTGLALYLLATPHQQRLPAKALVMPLALGGFWGMCMGGILLQILFGYR